MRTIKFRGRHLCGQWYWGNLQIIRRNALVRFSEPEDDSFIFMIHDVEDGSAEEVEEKTVGQFTGLLDNNGKEIYEGDVVKTKEGCIGYIVYEDVSFWIKSPGSCARDLERGSFYETVEIIGNIYDNKDLIKGE